VAGVTNVRPLQLAVMQILDAAVSQIQHDQPLYGDWSIQGFGLLRLYIRRIGRLHIWDPALRYPGVTMVHNHSWDLRSTVVSGCLVNRRWTEQPYGERWKRRRIVTGYDCRFVDPVDEDVFLIEEPRDVYHAGDVYSQAAKQIHMTDAEDGTITLMERTEDVNGEADLYWRETERWGTARPRPAMRQEVLSTIQKAYLVLEQLLRVTP
jgi:hypothetical protein